VDPGTTSAVAALNLDGELVLRESERDIPRHRMISLIIEHGQPVVVSCDTEKMPSTVEKIASSLGAERFEPENDLSSSRKSELGAGENSHEKDAQAAARHAYNSLRSQIRKIKRDSGEERPPKDVARRYFSDSLRPGRG
jgi:predicted RNase H-like nuclease (RuvC/YqgF family)